jgi:DNA-binding response OmpR family regulator
MSHGEKIRILIVDDDEPTRSMYAEVFKQSGFEVMEAKDGLEGLDIATKENPDVIFSGIIMPRMDGFTMMEALKKNVSTSNIPVVISSHLGREEDRAKATELGAKDFIVRDFMPPNQVMERINTLFKRKYRLQFDPYALDAQEMARDMGLTKSFQCMECDERMMIVVGIEDAEKKKFNARFVCPKCGWKLV